MVNLNTIQNSCCTSIQYCCTFDFIFQIYVQRRNFIGVGFTANIYVQREPNILHPQQFWCITTLTGLRNLPKCRVTTVEDLAASYNDILIAYVISKGSDQSVRAKWQSLALFFVETVIVVAYHRIASHNGILENSVDTGQIPQNVASDMGLHYFDQKCVFTDRLRIPGGATMNSFC